MRRVHPVLPGRVDAPQRAVRRRRPKATRRWIRRAELAQILPRPPRAHPNLPALALSDGSMDGCPSSSSSSSSSSDSSSSWPSSGSSWRASSSSSSSLAARRLLHHQIWGLYRQSKSLNEA
uniref:Uncharacterized protein n=1 Tax=Leersia perrieri TaxID=77586 RepID=A0A0D9WSE2_9ORYZ